MEGKLTAHWSPPACDVVCFGEPGDAALIHNMLYGGGTNVIDELKLRGYDLRTLRFSIQKREEECERS